MLAVNLLKFCLGEFEQITTYHDECLLRSKSFGYVSAEVGTLMNGAVILHISSMCFLVALSLLVWDGISILVHLRWIESTT